MVCTGFIQPLDLQCLFVNTLAGSVEIFMGLAFLAIAIIAGKFRMLNITVAIMYGLFIILVTFIFNGWLMLMVLLLGFAISFSVSKLVKQ
jgi:hypothetical protein